MKNNFVFFGSSPFSIFTLQKLKESSSLPSLIVTLPDQPRGRGMKIQPNVVKEWALNNNVSVLETEKLSESDLDKIKEYNPEVLLVVASGLFIPKIFLKEFENKVLNLHPSLLPKYRGPSPLQNLILNNDLENAGISLIVLDNQIDHGGIVASQKYEGLWPTDMQNLGKNLFEIGAEIFVNNLDDFLSGKIKVIKQDDSLATFTKKIEKSEGEINLEDNDFQNYLKYLAYTLWPGIFYFEDGKRVKIKRADFKDNRFVVREKIVVNN